jgi:hypothetical protein
MFAHNRSGIAYQDVSRWPEAVVTKKPTSSRGCYRFCTNLYLLCAGHAGLGQCGTSSSALTAAHCQVGCLSMQLTSATWVTTWHLLHQPWCRRAAQSAARRICCRLHTGGYWRRRQVRPHHSMPESSCANGRATRWFEGRGWQWLRQITID